MNTGWINMCHRKLHHLSIKGTGFQRRPISNDCFSLLIMNNWSSQLKSIIHSFIPACFLEEALTDMRTCETQYRHVTRALFLSMNLGAVRGESWTLDVPRATPRSIFLPSPMKEVCFPVGDTPLFHKSTLNELFLLDEDT